MPRMTLSSMSLIMNPQRLCPENDMTLGLLSPENVMTLSLPSPENDMTLSLLRPENDMTLTLLSPEYDMTPSLLSPENDMTSRLLCPENHMTLSKNKVPCWLSCWVGGWFPLDLRIGRANKLEFKTMTGFLHEYTRVKNIMFEGERVDIVEIVERFCILVHALPRKTF